MLPFMLSYAQNYEDVVLRRVFADRETGFYVDVGACDPLEDSVTHHFSMQGWHGVNIEPDARLHAALVAARPRDVNLHAAIGPEFGRAGFFPTATRGHGTLRADIAATRSAAPAEEVPQLPLGHVFASYVPDSGVDFLKIDVEGSEAVVIASADWKQVRPRIILVEAVDAEGRPTHADWEPRLLEAGYRFGLFDGLNRFYCRDEDADQLLPRLSAPASVLDHFRLAREVRGSDAEHARAAALTEELAQARDAWARREAELAAALATEQAAHGHALSACAAEEAAHARTRAEVSAQQTALTRTRTELSVERAALARARTELSAEQVVHARTRTELSAERAAHAQTRTALADAQAVHAGTEARLGLEQAAHARSRAELAAVYTSTCWRITAPLRDTVYFSRLLRRGGV